MMMLVRHLGLQPYVPIWNQMKEFTLARSESTADELWILEHPPVYTLGQAGKKEHILNSSGIDVVHSDRGGQVTYHGPGQMIAYVLLDLRRRKLGIKSLVLKLEQILIHLLKNFHISASIRCGAPGVYVKDKKIASIGLRVKNGCTYHGIALNVAMNLSPFNTINPCGFPNLEMTQISDLVSEVTMAAVCKLFSEHFIAQFEV